jgi:NhaP-type Na+/H+ or K+/H+ antiporter
VGVLVALCINYLLMAHLSLSVLNISWSSFFRAQVPALWLTLVVGVVTLATMAGVRHFDVPAFPSLLVGLLLALVSAKAAASLAPILTLGDHGMRMRDTVKAHWLARVHPPHVGEPT